ncbi:60S ribosomal protein L34 [Tetranychus urticae]|uniref:60S ribosomal protein L34 n=1 Tax=Tetranychus urticae TaxID=32264 RepID=UPI00077BD7BE|nr:60S ribosomal protein L34 [Tetranychus urticae]
MAQRQVLRRRLCYNTPSNRRKISKTPGGRLVYLYQKKPGTCARCGDCKLKLRGLTFARPHKLSTLSKRHKTVSRSYGGVRCAACLKNRILRAFLIEEEKIIAQVMKAQKQTKS